MPYIENPIMRGNIVYQCSKCGKVFLLGDVGEKHEKKCNCMRRAIARADLFVGRHMSAKRWILAWALLFTAAIMLMVRHGGWVVAIGTPVAIASLFMIVGNAGRIE